MKIPTSGILRCACRYVGVNLSEDIAGFFSEEFKKKVLR
jgi:hypothetical protein